MNPSFYHLYRPTLAPRVWLSRKDILLRYPL